MNFEIAPKSTETYLKWDDARLYCFALNIDGKTGWRLPTINELVEIYYTQHNLRLDNYWSSTVACDDTYAEMFAFHRHLERRGSKSWGQYVRAVRSID
jgi:hypothetical protein